MTKRFPISVTENDWHDSQKVNQDDALTEQQHTDLTFAALINNHFGSGILKSQATQNILFDSDFLDATQASVLAAGNFDGTGLQVALQPSDSTLGNQLEIELSDSDIPDAYHGPLCSVVGRKSIKVLVIGLDFQSNIQYDRLTFRRKEKQLTAKHYTKILAIFFNDFLGNNNHSRKLGGRVVIRESSSFQLSRDAIMVAQDVQPNIFFRDWKTTDPLITLQISLQTGMGAQYSVDGLGISTTVLNNRTLLPGDVTSQIGQKFLATTDNIQKITLLLGVEADTSVPLVNKYDWQGDLVISLYPLQKTVNCPTEIVPGLAIEFDPENVPIAQISYNQTTLLSAGIILTEILQPVDFVLSETQVGSTLNSVITSGEYYCITIRRSGAANSGVLFTGTGTDLLADSRLTLFNNVWVDAPDEDMWFQVWTDAAKVADGQAYDAGNGVDLTKTTTDPNTGAVIDNKSTDHPFANSSANALNIGLIQATEVEGTPTQDERTGNPVNSRKQFEPTFSFVDQTGLNDLQVTTEPLIIGCAQDINPKQNPSLLKMQNLPGLANGNSFCIVNPDPDLISLNLVGSRLIPNTSSGFVYRISKVNLCTDGYGDVNGDGHIDSADIARAAVLDGYGLSLTSTQAAIAAGTVSVLEIIRADVDGDGFVTSHDVELITKHVEIIDGYAAFPVGDSFTRICITVEQNTGRYDGYYDAGDGYVRLSTNNIIPISSLTSTELLYYGYESTIDISATDPSFLTVPFVPIEFAIQPQQFWQDFFLIFSSNARYVPASFTYDTGIQPIDTSAPLVTKCVDRTSINQTVDPGRNDFFVPDNLIIGKGQIIRPDGTYYKVDFEVAHVIIELPQIPLNNSLLNVFDKFVADRGDGFTVAGFPAMRFADSTTVPITALLDNQVRFGVSIQAFCPNIDGYTSVDGYGVIVDDIIGIYMDQNTGLLTLTIKDLSVDPFYVSLVTKIQVTVYLKKAGFVNTTLVVTPDVIPGLLSV
jgi:hypothetical protein